MNTSTKKKKRINDDSCSSGVCIVRRYHLALILFSVLAVASISQVHQFQPSTTTSSTTTADRAISISTSSSTSARRSTGLEDYIVSPIVGGLRATPSFTSTCRYYLDESAIPNGGLGVFTAVGIHKDDPVGAPPHDVCIYVADTPSKITAFTTHSWGRDVYHGGTFEGHNPRAACEGFATLYNAQPAPHVANAKIISPRVTTNAGLHRATHPGAGAITSYYGITSQAIDLIAAGSEVTIDYGDWHFDKTKEYKKPMKSVEALHQHGMCIDNIYVRPSSFPEMGRGAFATRAIRQGDLVAPAPLQVFENRKDFATQQGPQPEALFVNYCFQVAGNAKLMLYPYGPGVNLINHAPTATTTAATHIMRNSKIQKPEANVGLRWSSHRMHHKELLDLSVEDFVAKAKPGKVILELYSLRDIAEDEELLLDYGKDWQDAWNKHVQEWKPTLEKGYIYPHEMDETAPLRTEVEQQEEPYAPNLAMVCNTPDWDRKQDGVNHIDWHEPDFDWLEGFVFCHVIDRYEGPHGDLVYTVSLDFDEDPHEYDPSIPMSKQYNDRNVPRRAIRFVDKPYSSDMHLPNAFRHTIELPKELVPDQWVMAATA